MNIELRHLRYFIAVAEELHFGRAAQRLHISQPPLSQQIMQLEAETGAQLFNRTNRSVQLTPAGAQFLQDARAILLQVEQATQRAARLHRGEEGELRIGFTSSAAFIGVMSDALYVFRQRWPNVHVQMQEINTRQQLAPLHEGKLDLGVMRNTPLPADLHHQLLLREPLCAVVHKAHPLATVGRITLQALAREPFVFFDPQVGTALYSEILDLLQRYQIRPYITQEVGEAMTILGLVATGLGVSILPASFSHARLANVVWLPLEEPDAQSEMWLVWSGEREMSAQMAHMMALLRRE
ncbi:DNA-binding transcriptional LysR family regulator [Pantoea sp. PA1]|jgi:DNA-binding transcriptional LysR family regulator|uniref:LysR family transcriptional regulator n=1 Tax=Pantoea ananas TaxID=553 RepID=UPI0002418577|nr:LysR family transcriptional regulator [Pantoea ananatis]KNA28535.1 LysR family transcriptional regulator [Pantoea ananatis]MDH0053624.1 LysR family transcriptional regulator [Pantoea ananatis]MDJ0030169.1 LysR family transcriptional regulator [Pantoea ananatis]MDJ0045020.1 LysR family transcriptional regulator [Pantoea ananatis]CCF09593.1 LysR family transcriptional regulator [Pantoea ananatis LMG 5342]